MRMKLDLQHIEAGSFAFLHNLSVLDLSNCKLHDVKDGMFNGLVNLETLNLDKCLIKFVQKNAFADLHKLKFLILSNNYLKRVDAKIFDKLTGLTELNLSRNEILGVHKNAFSNLAALTFLDLSFNKLKSIKAKTYTSLVNLQTLYLHENTIEHFECEIFDRLSNLKLITLFKQTDSFLKLNRDTLWTIYKQVKQIKYECNLLLSKVSYSPVAKRIYVGIECTGCQKLMQLKSKHKIDISADSKKLLFSILETIFNNDERREFLRNQRFFDQWRSVCVSVFVVVIFGIQSSFKFLFYILF